MTNSEWSEKRNDFRIVFFFPQPENTGKSSKCRLFLAISRCVYVRQTEIVPGPVCEPIRGPLNKLHLFAYQNHVFKHTRIQETNRTNRLASRSLSRLKTQCLHSEWILQTYRNWHPLWERRGKTRNLPHGIFSVHSIRVFLFFVIFYSVCISFVSFRVLHATWRHIIDFYNF